jgi:hypothetical protein
MMIQGFYLSLLAGPAIPVPVPASVADSLISARVTIATTQDTLEPGEPPVSARSGFELQFTLGKNSPLETLFLLSSSAPPLLRVVLVATVHGTPEVIMDGFAQRVHVQPGGGARASVLTVYGKDVTAAMDLIEFNGLPFPALPITARVALLLAKYALLGVVPLVIPPVFEDIPDPTERICSQKGTDYAYVTSLARDCGYVFYSDPGPVPGMSRAYWGPEIKVGVPQPALNIDMDALTNVESLSFSFDNEKSTTPIALLRRDELPIPIPVPIPDVSLTNPPLGLIPPMSFRIEPLPDTTKMSLPQALLFGLARKSASSECVTAEGTLDVARYGRLLKARQLVGVRGAGTAFDGLYYVKKVTHEIRRGEYKQSFTLTRNGLVSTVPKVPV